MNQQQQENKSLVLERNKYLSHWKALGLFSQHMQCSAGGRSSSSGGLRCCRRLLCRQEEFGGLCVTGEVLQGCVCCCCGVSAIVSSAQGTMPGTEPGLCHMQLCLSPFPLFASNCCLCALPKGTLCGLTTASAALAHGCTEPSFPEEDPPQASFLLEMAAGSAGPGR